MYHNVGHVPEALGEGASRLSSALPVYLQPWHRRNLGYAQGKCPNAGAFYACALSFPLFPATTYAGVAEVNLSSGAGDRHWSEGDVP